MRIVLAVMMLCCLLGANVAFATSKQSDFSPVELSRWMTYYYMHKDHAKMPDFLQSLQQSQMLDKYPNTQLPTAAFLAVIFTENPHKVDIWSKSIGFSGNMKHTMQQALRLSENRLPNKPDDMPVLLREMSLKTSAELDMMWAAFSASGDTYYVQKIIDVLDKTKPLTGDSTADTVMRGAATWSLGSNMMQHELVRRVIYQEMEARSGVVRQALEDIRSEYVKKIKPFPNKEGEFSAMLVVTAEKELSEYAKPAHEGMHFKEKLQAQRGDIIAIKIVFAGMELTNDLQADVTYDMKITDPNGNIYDGADMHQMDALKGKVPMRFRVFDNRSFLKLRFEPDDALGAYHIRAIVHDNVGKKSLGLSKKVELVQ